MLVLIQHWFVSSKTDHEPAWVLDSLKCQMAVLCQQLKKEAQRLTDDTFCLTSSSTDLITLIMLWEAEINYSLNLPKKIILLSHVFCFKIIYTSIKRQFSFFSFNILYTNSLNSPSENWRLSCARQEGDALKLSYTACCIPIAVQISNHKQDAQRDLLHPSTKQSPPMHSHLRLPWLFKRLLEVKPQILHCLFSNPLHF